MGGILSQFLRQGFRPVIKNRTVAICMVKNERDIIEPFLRHNGRFFDEFIVLDHNSTDDTAEITRKCAEEIGHIHLRTVTDPAQHQGRFVTEALHHAARDYRPEFVALLDADEFIDSPDRPAFERSLRGIPKNGVGAVRWQTYLPAPGSDVDVDPIARMQFRRREEHPAYQKIILRLSASSADHIVVEQGNHGAHRTNGAKLRAVALGDLLYMHLPVRSREQVISKCSTGWLANSMRADGAAGEAYQWAEIGRLVIESGVPLSEIEIDLPQFALDYAQEGIVTKWPENTEAARPAIRYERRYTDGSFGDPLALISEALRRGRKVD